MFDPVTASLLRSAPEVPGLDPADIPQLLTRQYAALVSARMRGSEDAPADAADFEWPLERIADTYELVTSISNEGELRRASAFVAATAHQILARRQASRESVGTYLINRDGVAPTLASALLFLAAEQYADANEAANSIEIPARGELYESRILAEHITDLAKGNLSAILDRGARWRRPPNPVFPIEAQALIILLEALASGIEILAAEILARPRPEQTTSRFDTSHGAFTRVLQLSSFVSPAHSLDIGGDLFTSYPGPRHMASLLRAAHDGIRHAAITAVPPPVGADQNYWNRWLQFRANLYPYVWPNHREAIQKKFYETNVSAVMVLPTGAGKTTVSAIKIAGALARGKKVVFLAPTHALVEQLTGDLQDVFPKELLGSAVSSDFDLLAANTQLQEIEVMTPERCLAMLSFAPAAFEDVGLLVFDECHLLSPQSGKIRRALDGMLCLLAFNHLAPQADLLFLSAMLDNGAEFTEWITELTGRHSIFVDLLWKPSRQARGVIIYSEPQLESIRNAALQMQMVLNTKAGKSAKGLRTASKSLLVAEPRAIWGLQHNWLSESHAHCSITSLANEPVTLSGDIKFNKIRLTPNANQVAARLAVSAARNGLKTIVFVNTKADAVSTAHEVSIQLADPLKPTELEKAIWDALEIELGGLQYSLIEPSACAVPHNSSMFRLERDLAERMFRRDNGAKVIVATPTLAQGLNLPAQLAILAGDKRADSKNKGRENLEAHELLNAAARAGRAGHLANGVVLLIPEPNISYTDGQNLDFSVIQKLRSILPEDDRCVSITDPLEVVLDRLMSGQLVDRDVKYTLNRMAALNASSEEDAASIFNLNKSLGFYAAKKKNDEKTFNEKIETLKFQIELTSTADPDKTLSILASQSGLPADLLNRLRSRITGQIGGLPTTISSWLAWTIEWLAADEDARGLILEDIAGSMLAATGRKKTDPLVAEVLAEILAGVTAWITGKTIVEIEAILGGNPDTESATAKHCPRSRELVGTVIPRGMSFILGLVSHIVQQVGPFDQQEGLDSDLVEMLSTAVRRGFDTPGKLQFALNDKKLIGRVQAHKAWAAQFSLFAVSIDEFP